MSEAMIRCDTYYGVMLSSVLEAIGLLTKTLGDEKKCHCAEFEFCLFLFLLELRLLEPLVHWSTSLATMWFTFFSWKSGSLNRQFMFYLANGFL